MIVTVQGGKMVKGFVNSDIHKVTVDFLENGGEDRLIEYHPFDTFFESFPLFTGLHEHDWKDFSFLCPRARIIHALFCRLKKECEKVLQKRSATAAFLHIESCSKDMIGKRAVAIACVVQAYEHVYLHHTAEDAFREPDRHCRGYALLTTRAVSSPRQVVGRAHYLEEGVLSVTGEKFADTYLSYLQ